MKTNAETFNWEHAAGATYGELSAAIHNKCLPAEARVIARAELHARDLSLWAKRSYDGNPSGNDTIMRPDNVKVTDGALEIAGDVSVEHQIQFFFIDILQQIAALFPNSFTDDVNAIEIPTATRMTDLPLDLQAGIRELHPDGPGVSPEPNRTSGIG